MKTELQAYNTEGQLVGHAALLQSGRWLVSFDVRDEREARSVLKRRGGSKVVAGDGKMESENNP